MKENFLKLFKTTNYFRFNVYDITIAGIFLAFFIIIDYVTKITLTGRWAFSFDIGFYILFGIILGPIKGVAMAILADTLSLLIFGKIGFWMWQYAIIPPAIAIVSWLFFYFYLGSAKWKIYVPHITLFLTIIIFFAFYLSFVQNPNLVNRVVKSEEISALTILIIASVFFIAALIFVAILILLYQKTQRKIFLTVLFVFTITTFIMVISRWLWNPFAFIAYYNQFIAPTTKSKRVRGIEQYYIFYLIPAILKSLIAIPTYTALLTIFLPIIFKLNKNYKNIVKMAY